MEEPEKDPKSISQQPINPLGPSSRLRQRKVFVHIVRNHVYPRHTSQVLLEASTCLESRRLLLDSCCSY